MVWNGMGVLKMTAITTTIKQLYPTSGKKFVFINATTTNATDYITVTGLSVIEGIHLVSSTGATTAAGTWATNVYTLSNGATGTKIWSGFAWGY